MKIMEEIKQHPYVAGVGIFVLGIVLIFILMPGKKVSADSAAYPATDTSAATQVQMAAINANAAMYAADKAAQVTNAQTAGAVSIAQLQAQTQQNSDTQNYQAATAVASIQRDMNIGVSTLQANALMHESDNALTGTLSTNQTMTSINGQNTAAAVAINGQNTNAAMTINGQNVSGAIAINQQNTDLAAMHATLDYQAAMAANASAAAIAAKKIDADYATNHLNQDYAYWTNASNNKSSNINTAINNNRPGMLEQIYAAG